MNRTYALVWNPSLAAWTVTDERARRRAKGAGAVLAAALLLPLTAIAADLPTGGNVVAGDGSISQPAARQMVIDQASNKLAIEWQSFDIAAGNKVTFNQPGRDAIALNRVLGADGSKIMGQLDANGRVFLINPNGVLFGAGAQVNVGGLVASTLDISNSDFVAGNYKFKGDGSNASVINNGQITAADGGSIALLGGTVSNNGVIVANQGTVALAAGNAVTLDFAGDGLLNVQVDEAVVDALVENHQLIKADGGQVLLTANAGDALLKTVVNNTGVIEAHTLGEKDGKIVLLGSFDGGTVQVAGTLDASAPNGGDGGFIETSGAHVKVADSAKVTTKAASGKTGTWLIDPTDFTVSAGDDPETTSGIGADTLSYNLTTTGAVVQTVASGTDAGDINVNAAVTWNAATTLTLNAHNNININAAITAQHANGKVALKYGQASTDGDGADYSIKAPINLQSGQNFSTQKGSNGTEISYTVVNDATALQDRNSNLNGNYAVGSNIDLSSISNWMPVGDDSNNFTGQFAGLGHTLSNLTIDRSGTDFVGLFGYTGSKSVIRDIGLVGGSVWGSGSNGGGGGGGGTSYSGALVGYNSGTLNNAYATGSVSANGGSGGGGSLGGGGGGGGDSHSGALVGYNTGTINNAYATGSVSANGGSGGGGSLGGGDGSDGTSYSGGLVGFNQEGAISNSFYATTDAAGNAINNSGATTGAFSGNGLGTGKTWAELSDPATFSGWDQSIWSFPAVDTSVSGYGVGLPYLTGVTRQADIIRGTLFTDGFGTQNSAYTITSWQQLANINRVLNGGYYFSLSNNLDQNSTGYTTLASATANGGAGWNPLGNNSNQFTGTFNGLSHTISDLVINRSGTSYVGLFGYTGSDSVIRDIGLVGGSVKGRGSDGTKGTKGGDSYSGALVGRNFGFIYNAYATGSVSASGGSGGNAMASAGNGGNAYSGGLVGYNSGTINNAYATGSVSGSGGSGGKSDGFGSAGKGGSGYSGGLVGFKDGGQISNAYATGSVSANGGSAPESSGSGYSGGLVGYNSGFGTITSSFYATTDANGSPINSSSNKYGTGRTRAELTLASTFTDSYWDIASTGGSDAVWRIYDGHSGPLLRSFLQSVTLTADASGGSKTYDSTAATGNTTYTSSSLGSDLDTGKILGSSLGYASNSKNAGTYSSANGSLILSGLYSGQQGYDISYADTSLTISKADLAITNISALNKTYDATTHASLTGSVEVNVLGSDIVSVSDTGIGSFADANADSNKAVTVSGYSLTGADAGNYNLLQPTGVTATINKADLTLSGSKVYDGSTTVAGSTLTATGVAGETFTVTGAGNASNLTNKNVQSGAALASITGLSLGSSSNGGLASNYNAPGVAGSSYTVTAKGLTLTGISAVDKIYDATTTATLNTANVGYSGLVSGDTVTLAGNGKGSFANKNSGANKAVTVSGYSLDGADAGNYIVTQPSGLTATINKADLAVTGIRASDKTYDATTAATLSGSAAVTAISGDTVSLSGPGVGTFADKNAGGNKAVTVSGYTLIGTDAGNYNIVQPSGLTANISKADLAVTDISASNKTYDGTTAATLTGNAAVTAISGDTVSLNGTGVGTFADKNAGGNKAVTVTGYTLSGNDADNYNILQPTGLTADINKAALTVTASDASKTSGQSIALTGYSANGLVGDDRISAVSLSSLGQPSTAAAGSYAIVASDAVGAALSNYDIDYQDGILLVSPEPVATPSTANSQPYIGAMVANSQTVAAPESTSPASEPEVLNPQMLMTNPLADIMNLQVINQGIRLPEGI